MTINKSISLEGAVSICCQQVEPMAGEYVNIDGVCLRVCARDILADSNVPNFDRSAVDGFAICSADLENLDRDELGELEVIGVIKAGSSNDTVVDRGNTYRIMTGALLPEGTAAVIKQEDVEQRKNTVYAAKKLKMGENIQPAGSDISAGKQVAVKGQVLDAETIERIASCGVEKVLVHKHPQIYVINSGSELVLPGCPLQKGQIYHSNRSLLSAKITAAGGIPVLADTGAEDELDVISNEMEKGASSCDMVIISGGTGYGAYDLVHDSLKRIGAKLLFRGIDILPGKGAAAAMHKNVLMFNLAGNPGAGSLLFEVLIKPSILRLRGAADSGGGWFDINLADSVKKISKRRSLRRAKMFINKSTVLAYPVGKKDEWNEGIPVILDIKPGQGNKGDTVRAMMI